jgi:hypothetical protein
VAFPPEPLSPEQRGKVTINCCGAGKNKDAIDGFFSTGIGGPSIYSKPPHPNAAKVFINWLLTREGQVAWVKDNEDQTCSARRDMQAVCGRPQKLEEGKAYMTTHRKSNVHWRVEAQNVIRQVLGR